ncbi:MAG: hypothetical protein ACP5E2_08570 [Terracidiphilus sp.]
MYVTTPSFLEHWGLFEVMVVLVVVETTAAYDVGCAGGPLLGTGVTTGL